MRLHPRDAARQGGQPGQNLLLRVALQQRNRRPPPLCVCAASVCVRAPPSTPVCYSRTMRELQSLRRELCPLLDLLDYWADFCLFCSTNLRLGFASRT